MFEFLVKSIAGSTAELLCRLGGGDVVELTPAMGKGFEINQISPLEDYQSVLIFATGSGISGYSLLQNPHHNMGLAFTDKDRDAYYLQGLLPPVVVNQEL